MTCTFLLTLKRTPSGDVEGHVTQDGQHFLLDLARVFPAGRASFLSCPWLVSQNVICVTEYGPACAHIPSARHSVFFRSLRPEFLQWLARHKRSPALNSDALTRWGLHAGSEAKGHDRSTCELCQQFDEDNHNIRSATEILVKEVVPTFSRFLVRFLDGATGKLQLA